MWLKRGGRRQGDRSACFHRLFPRFSSPSFTIWPGWLLKDFVCWYFYCDESWCPIKMYYLLLIRYIVCIAFSARASSWLYQPPSFLRWFCWFWRLCCLSWFSCRWVGVNYRHQFTFCVRWYPKWWLCGKRRNYCQPWRWDMKKRWRGWFLTSWPEGVNKCCCPID